MFFNKQKKRKGKFVKAKTPEARKRQKAAVAAYYEKKRESTDKK